MAHRKSASILLLLLLLLFFVLVAREMKNWKIKALKAIRFLKWCFWVTQSQASNNRCALQWESYTTTTTTKHTQCYKLQLFIIDKKANAFEAFSIRLILLCFKSTFSPVQNNNNNVSEKKKCNKTRFEIDSRDEKTAGERKGKQEKWKTIHSKWANTLITNPF